MSVNNDFTTAQAMVEQLVSIGVRKAFGIVSIHNLPIYQAISQEGSIDLITTRGESGAVNMADGYARATGRLGVVITSTGTGAGNAAGSLVEAWNAGTPILHITGEVESKYINMERYYIHEAKNQFEIMQGACKNTYRLKKAERAVGTIRKSIRNAIESPSGPVTIEIPIDFQTAIIPRSCILGRGESNQENLKNDDIYIPSKIIDMIYESKRPLIWAGGGVIKSEGSEEFKEIVELINAPVITSQSGKGAISEDHPLCIGFFPSDQKTKEFIKKSDLLISIGTNFRGTETSLWEDFLPQNHISINTNIEAFNTNYPVTYGFAIDAKKFLKSLVTYISEEHFEIDSQYIEEVDKLRHDLWQSLLTEIGPYKDFVECINNTLTEDTIFVRDVTVPANLWGNKLIKAHKPRKSFYIAGGGIGQGLPIAIGAKSGSENQPVVLMTGDGGFMVNAVEMATANQEKLPLVILLFDDSGYGVLRGIQKGAYNDNFSVDLRNPNFIKLGESMGFRSIRIETSEEFDKQFQKAFKNQISTLIIVDMYKIEPNPKQYSGTRGGVPNYQPKKIE